MCMQLGRQGTEASTVTTLTRKPQETGWGQLGESQHLTLLGRHLGWWGPQEVPTEGHSLVNFEPCSAAKLHGCPGKVLNLPPKATHRGNVLKPHWAKGLPSPQGPGQSSWHYSTHPCPPGSHRSPSLSCPSRPAAPCFTEGAKVLWTAH